MADGKNSIVDIKKYLTTDDMPVSSKEMSDFWNSLSEDEKEEYKNAELD